MVASLKIVEKFLLRQASPWRDAERIKNLNQKLFELTVNKLTSMTQDEKWQAKYNEVVEFINFNHRNPSNHRIEEHNMLNWLKANRKLLNAGTLKPDRMKMFEKLQGLMEENKRVNQYI